MSSVPPQNGSLMLAWQVKNRHVLLVGGGEVATGRVNLLLQANAKITIVSPEVSSQIKEWDEQGLIHKVLLRKYEKNDLSMYESTDLSTLPSSPRDEDFQAMERILNEERFALVLTAIPDHDLSQVIHYHCKLKNLQCNIADRPKICDFYFGAMFRKGPLQIMISSNGNSPRLTRRIKDEIVAKSFDDIDVDRAVENLGYLRNKLRSEKAIGDTNEIIKQRMSWNIGATDTYSIQDWGKFSTEELNKILSFYPNKPPAHLEDHFEKLTIK